MREKIVTTGRTAGSTSLGAHVVSGLAVRAHHLVVLLGELAHAFVPHSLEGDEGSTAPYHDEDEVGGFSFSLRFAVTL
ncbi:MAG: hypothetical protein HYV63_12290 [Candidatus Schekmanbacteria bacterium]|nr:hypothetical protein [Candidatus Schekmanbacteria bacterium]